jgi:hypothetical protein
MENVMFNIRVFFAITTFFMAVQAQANVEWAYYKDGLAYQDLRYTLRDVSKDFICRNEASEDDMTLLSGYHALRYSSLQATFIFANFAQENAICLKKEEVCRRGAGGSTAGVVPIHGEFLASIGSMTSTCLKPEPGAFFNTSSCPYSSQWHFIRLRCEYYPVNPDAPACDTGSYY